jgi:transcriptional regulator with XRE-family HTH domain
MDMNASVAELASAIPNPPQDLVSAQRRDLETVRKWVDWISMGVDRLNSRFFSGSESQPLTRELVLQNSFPACALFWHGHAELGRVSLINTWIDSSLLSGHHQAALRTLRDSWLHEVEPIQFDLASADAELLAIFNAAVGERILAEAAAWQGRQIIRDLLIRLGLSREEVAKMFQVSVETLNGWESGSITIPKENLTQVQAASRALSKLLGIFRPERLPQVIRREAELFDGKTAVDWIVDGHISEVADRYDQALAYQA